MKMWDGRFSKPSDRLMEQFHNSLPFDQKLIEEDIQGSIAWAGALKEIAIFTADEYQMVKRAWRRFSVIILKERFSFFLRMKTFIWLWKGY